MAALPLPWQSGWKPRQDGSTALHVAAALGRAGIVDVLLCEQAIHPAPRDRVRGATTLRAAAAPSDALTLCCLPLQNWVTPRQLAVRLGSDDTAALLAGSDDALPPWSAPPPPAWPGVARMERLRAEITWTDPSRHRNLLGSALFERIVEMLPDWAPKITGMLLEMGDTAVLGYLGEPGGLERKVEEAVGVLRAAGVMPHEGGGEGGGAAPPPVARPQPPQPVARPAAAAAARLPPHLQPPPGGWRGGGGGGALPRVPPPCRLRGAPPLLPRGVAPPPVPPPPSGPQAEARARAAAAGAGRGASAAAASGAARR